MPELDKKAYLVDPAEWTEEIASIRSPRIWSTG